MKKILKYAAWFLSGSVLLLIVGYNVFVSFRFGRLPANRLPVSSEYPFRIQTTFWFTSFGNQPMKIEPMPFWKLLATLPKYVEKHGKISASFSASVAAGRVMNYQLGDQKRSFEHGFNELFAAIWISQHWTAEEAVNTLLDTIYFGHDFHGIKRASIGFYGVQPGELTNEEMIFLSASAWRPNAHDPWEQGPTARNWAAELLKKAKRIGKIEVDTNADLCFRRLQPRPGAE